MTSAERLPALGQAPGAADDDDPDFAGEHEDTAVSKDVTAGRDDAESESPAGWAGLESAD